MDFEQQRRISLDRFRPWGLRAAAVLRVVVLAALAPRLFGAGLVGLLFGVLLIGCAVGLWFKRIWPWRIALLTDIGLVIYYAMTLVDAPDISLFTYVATGTVIDVLLLTLGQEALVRRLPPPPE